MDNFPSNSRRIPTTPQTEPVPEKKFEKPLISSEHVIRRKKGLGQRFTETFFKAGPESVMRYLVEDVVVPNVKDFIFDFFNQGLQQALFGEVRNHTTRPGTQRNPSTGMITTPYHSRFTKPTPATTAAAARTRRDEPEFDDNTLIILRTKVEAQETLEAIEDTIDRYGSFSVADLNDMLGQTGPYTDSRWGWRDMRGFTYTQDRAGWRLVLPTPIDLKLN